MASEIQQRETESAGPVCQKCQHPLLETEKTRCPACKEEKKELFGQMAARALVVGEVVAGGLYVVVKLLLRIVGFLSPKKKS